MARKIDPRPQLASAPSGADASAADELDVLFPARTIPLQKGEVTVAEITLRQSLQHHLAVAPIIAAIETAMLESGQVPGYSDIVGILGQHWEATITLLAATTGMDADEVSALTAADGELLLLTFWNVNAGFFYQRATNAVAVRRELAKLSTGASSSPPSSTTDTPEQNSTDTPPAN